MASVESKDGEEAMYARIQQYTSSQQDVSVDEVMADIRKFGIKRLIDILEAGIDTFGSKKLINNVLFMHLYTACHTAALQGDAISEKLHGEARREMMRCVIALPRLPACLSAPRAVSVKPRRRGLCDMVVVRSYVRTSVLPALERTDRAYLVQEFRRRWDDHRIFTSWIRKMFLFLDKQMSKGFGGPNKLPLVVVSYQQFRAVAFEAIKFDLAAAIQELVNRERNGEGGVDRSLVKSVIDCFILMGCVDDLIQVHPRTCRASLPAAVTHPAVRAPRVLQQHAKVIRVKGHQMKEVDFPDVSTVKNLELCVPLPRHCRSVSVVVSHDCWV